MLQQQQPQAILTEHIISCKILFEGIPALLSTFPDM